MNAVRSVTTSPIIGQDSCSVLERTTEPRQYRPDGDYCEFHCLKTFCAPLTFFLGSRTFLTHPTLIAMTNTISEERRYQDGANLESRLCVQRSFFLYRQGDQGHWERPRTLARILPVYSPSSRMHAHQRRHLHRCYVQGRRFARPMQGVYCPSRS